MLSEYNEKNNENQWFFKFYTTIFNLGTPLHSSRVVPQLRLKRLQKISCGVEKHIYIGNV